MNVNSQQEILVVPRRLFADWLGFIPWDEFAHKLPSISLGATWLNRELAERSDDFVQIIPCGILHNASGEYCVQRRVKSTRSDLNKKITLTFGGHIDKDSQLQADGFLGLLLSTLRRELEEELGVKSIHNISNVGLIIDPASLSASRHIAFVFQARVDSKISALATEEFALGSKYNASFLKIHEISALRSFLDPWSKIVFEERLNPKDKPAGRQIGLMLNA